MVKALMAPLLIFATCINAESESFQKEVIASVKDAKTTAKGTQALQYLSEKLNQGVWTFDPTPTPEQITSMKPRLKAKALLPNTAPAYAPRWEVVQKQDSAGVCQPLTYSEFRTETTLVASDCPGANPKPKAFLVDDSGLGSLEQSPAQGEAQRGFIVVGNLEQLSQSQSDDHFSKSQTLTPSSGVQAIALKFLAFVPDDAANPKSVKALRVQAGNLLAEVPVVTKNRICPPNYVQVQANATLGTSAFCVAKYEMKKIAVPLDEKLGLKSGFRIVAKSQASSEPWTSINRDESLKACRALGAQYDLIDNSQWQALAREIETVQSPPGNYLNWSNNTNLGRNFLNQGHSDRSPAKSLAAGGDDEPCAGTENLQCASKLSPDYLQKRTHVLTSGEIIWDVSGNVIEWIKDNPMGAPLSPDDVFNPTPSHISSAGPVSLKGWSGTHKRRWGPEGTYTDKNVPPYGGLGWAVTVSPDPLWSSAGLNRGGGWGSDGKDGIFSFIVNPTNSSGSGIGFRCVYKP